MSGFAEFAAAAQVGIRKTSAPAGPLGVEGAPEDVVLRELGALGLMRRAGLAAMPHPALDAAPPEELRVAEGAAEPIRTALDDGMASLVAAWAAEATRRGFVAPAAVLLQLVPLARKSPEVRSVLGERGRWLAGLMGLEPEVAGAPPAKEEYDALDWKARAALVAGLPEDDPALFERALGDRKREVRDAAAERLVRLPGSPQAQALRALARAAVAVRRGLLGPSLHVVPPVPETLPAWLPRGVAQSGIGPVALALRDLVAHVPPSLWTEAPDRLLVLAAKTDYGKALFEGWYESAFRFDDGPWIDALLRHYAAHEAYVPPAVARRASAATFESAALERLGGKQSPESSFRFLTDGARPLSPTLSRALIEAVRRGGTAQYWLNDLAIRLDPSVVPRLDAPWGEDSAPERVRLRWRKILDLRLRLDESLR